MDDVLSFIANCFISPRNKIWSRWICSQKFNLCNRRIRRTGSFYLFDCFADNLFVLLLCDFLPLVKGLYGCFHFIDSFLLNLLFLKTEAEQKKIKYLQKRMKNRGRKEEEQQLLSDTVPSLFWSCRPEPCYDVRAAWWRTAGPDWRPADPPWSPWQRQLWSASGGGPFFRRPPLDSGGFWRRMRGCGFSGGRSKVKAPPSRWTSWRFYIKVIIVNKIQRKTETRIDTLLTGMNKKNGSKEEKTTGHIE